MRFTFITVATTAAAVLFVSFSALAAKPFSISVIPFEFVGDEEGCMGEDIVEAAWIPKTGLTNNDKSAHALFLEKDGDTAVCSAAGASIVGVAGRNLDSLEWDVKDDGHCGAGAPRFNVTLNDGSTYFIGCSSGTATSLGGGWTHYEYDLADAFPSPIPADNVIESITIIFDEGTDQGEGFVYLDNITVNVDNGLSATSGKPGKPK